MSDQLTKGSQIKIAKTGITGLDEILNGGFVRPSTLLIAGGPGMGKTTFAMQSLFNAARNGETCVYIPVLSESEHTMQHSMSQFTFYDHALYRQNKMHIFKLDDHTISEGDFAVFQFLSDYIQKIHPTRIAIDPITVLENVVKSFENRKMKRLEERGFALQLFNMMKDWDALVLLVGELTNEELRANAWGYLVDGIIVLNDRAIGKRRERYLEVLKMRGVKYMRGEHTFEIDSSGIAVYPMVTQQRITGCKWNERVSTGISGMDTMLGGGFLKTSANLLAGSAGSGKSVMGMHFIANGALNNEPCVVATFEMLPTEFIEFGDSFGLNLSGIKDKGFLDILDILNFPYDVNPYEFAATVKNRVKENRATRVLLDSITRVLNRIQGREETIEYLLSLITYFKNAGTTSMFTYDLPEILGTLKVGDDDIAFIMDTVIFLRYVEVESNIKKSITVLKMRGSEHDKEIREFNIKARGIEIKSPFGEYGSRLFPHYHTHIKRGKTPEKEHTHTDTIFPVFGE